MLELVAGKQVERADFSSADNRSVRPPSLSEVERSHRRNLRRLAFSGFHGLPPKISDGQEITNDMIPNAAGVMDQMRRLEHETQQKAEPAEPRSRDVSAAMPSEEVVSTVSFKEVELKLHFPRKPIGEQAPADEISPPHLRGRELPQPWSVR